MAHTAPRKYLSSLFDCAGAQMPATHDSHLERITIDSDVRFGKPCIRGHRITVRDIPQCTPVGHFSGKSWRIIPCWYRMTSLPCKLTLSNLRQGAKSPEAEAPLRRRASKRNTVYLRVMATRPSVPKSREAAGTIARFMIQQPRAARFVAGGDDSKSDNP